MKSLTGIALTITLAALLLAIAGDHLAAQTDAPMTADQPEPPVLMPPATMPAAVYAPVPATPAAAPGLSNNPRAANQPPNPLAPAGAASANSRIPPNPLSRPPGRIPAPAGGPPRVLILSFDAVDSTDKREWLGRSVQQGLLGDLAQIHAINVVTVSEIKGDPPPPGVIDTTAALTAGRLAAAQFVIAGSFQVVDPELRIIGVIIDVRSGQTVGSLKATGTVRDLFAMEDSLSNQARRQFAPSEPVRLPTTAPAALPTASTAAP